MYKFRNSDLVNDANDVARNKPQSEPLDGK